MSGQRAHNSLGGATIRSGADPAWLAETLPIGLARFGMGRRCQRSAHVPHPELCDLCCIYLTPYRYWGYALPIWHPTHVPRCHQSATHLAATGCHEGAENGGALVYAKLRPHPPTCPNVRCAGTGPVAPSSASAASAAASLLGPPCCRLLIYNLCTRHLRRTDARRPKWR